MALHLHVSSEKMMSTYGWKIKLIAIAFICLWIVIYTLVSRKAEKSQALNFQKVLD